MILHKNKGNNYSLFNSLDSQIKNIKFFNNFYFKIHYVHQANAFKTSKRYFKGSRLLRFPNGVCSATTRRGTFGVLPLRGAKQRGAASLEAGIPLSCSCEAAFGVSSEAALRVAEQAKQRGAASLEAAFGVSSEAAPSGLLAYLR